MSRVQLPNNEEAIIADFALDSTAQAMLTQLVALNKGIGSGNLQKLVEHAKEAAKDSEAYYKEAKKQQEDLHKATEDLGKEFKKTAKQAPTTGNAPGSDVAGPSAGKISEAANKAAGSLDGFNKGAAMGEVVFTNMYGAISSAITGISAAVVLYGGILVDSFVGLGSELNELTKVGAGFTDGLSRGGMSATDAMVQLSGMGIDAANTMKNMSGIMQTMNKKAFVGLTESFMDATNSGVELGMSLDDSVERMGAELAKRQQMGVLDGMNQARMQKQITRSIKTQQKYASVLGESVDNIVAFTDSLITQTPVLTSSLLRFDKELRGKVIAGITDFGSTMRAMGGEEGGQIAAAMTEAAASGAMGFSEQMTGYVRALPSLAGPMNDYIKQIKNGTLSQEEAEQMALDMTMQLGNLSAAEKNRIFLLDRAGDAQASSMAKAIIQFEASEKKLKAISKDLTMEGIQKGTNTLTAILKGLTGTFEAVKTSFLQGFGNIANGGADLGDTFEKMKKIVSESIGKAMNGFGLAGGAFDNLTDAGTSLGNQLGERLPGMLESFAKYIGMAIEALPGIWEGIKSFVSGFMSVMKVVGMVISPVISVFKFLAGVVETLASAVSFVLTPFTALGSWLGGFLGDTTEKAGGFANILGKLTGIALTLFLGFKAVSGVLGVFGKSLPSMFANMGKSMMEGAKNMMGKVTGGISKVTGGKLDGLFGKAKDKLTGKAKEMDMGTKAMDTASKKSKSFTKTLSTGMKDISKGISDVLTNLSKGISNSVSNIATGIQKGISALSKGIADAGKGIGAGIGGLLKGTLTGLGQGLKVLGDPKVLLGVIALTGIGAAMFVAGKAFQQFSDINWAGVAAGAVALGVLGTAAFLLAPIAPVIGVGALAIGALGLALLPFAAAVKIAAPAMVELMGSFQLLNEVDPKNVFLLGPALVSLAAGMAAFSAGGLISGVLDGLGSLFGSESPFDKLAKIGAAAPAINEMTSNMNSFGTTVETFNDAMTQLDGAAISGEFDKMAEGIDTLNASMAEISLVSIMKMAAMKSFGPVQQEQVDPVQQEQDVQQVQQEQALVKKEGAISPNDPKAPVDRSPAGRAARRRAELVAKRDQLDMSSGSASGTFVGGKLIKPVASQPANTPTKASAIDPITPTTTSDRTRYTDDNGNVLPKDSNKELFERMVANQEQTNSLLRRGNKTTADLKDSF